MTKLLDDMEKLEGFHKVFWGEKGEPEPTTDIYINLINTIRALVDAGDRVAWDCNEETVAVWRELMEKGMGEINRDIQILNMLG